MYHIIRSFVITILLFSPLVSFAQSAIESAMKALADSKSVTKEVFSERRVPGTNRIESSNRLYEFTDSKLAEKIIEAMRKEREAACEYSMVSGRSTNVVYSISFVKNNMASKYVLVRRGVTWTLSVNKQLATLKQIEKKSKTKSRTKKTSTRTRTRSSSSGVHCYTYSYVDGDVAVVELFEDEI